MHKKNLGCLVIATAMGFSIATIHSVETVNADEIVKYEIVDEAIPKALTAEAGDAERGKKTYVNRKKGNCLACHVTTDLKGLPFHGLVGPPMDGIASRMSEGELRLRVVNPKVVNEATIMPAFYRNDGFHRVLKKFKGKTMLSAQEVEDVVAYLMTMKDE